MTATYQAAIRLPDNNNDFGRKNVILLFDGAAIDSSDFEVFYPKDETNHPGGDQTPPNRSSARSPNWFYYWNRAIGAQVNIFYYDKTMDPMAETPAMRRWSYNATYNKTAIWVHRVAEEDLREGIAHTDRTGIDLFANAILHESVHVDQIQRADALLTQNGQAMTIWRHGWAWNQPPQQQNHFNPGQDFGFLDQDNNDLPDSWTTNGDGGVEPEARRAETSNNNAHWELDWGNPGKQCKTNQKYDDQ